MRPISKIALAAACAALALAAMPATAPAATKQCLYQGDEASESNRLRLERSLLCLTNVHRLRSGADPLLRDSRLFAAARAHSADMATRHYFAHDTPEGLDPSERAIAAGYPGGAGENIATNQTGTALSLFEQWRDSVLHNQEMLRSDYRAAGMGVDPRFFTGADGITGTQMFGFVAADGKDDALDLYANSKKCARAKLALIAKRRALKKKKGTKLKTNVKRAKRLVKEVCKDPPGSN